MSEATFTAEGFQPFPSVYHDTERAADYANDTLWPTPQLEAKLDEYMAFLQRPNLMPRARQAAALIIDRGIFELACREGVYDHLTAPAE